MSPLFILLIIFLYFGILLSISYFTSKGANNQTFFSANKQSPWYVVAFGMIGASLSGVTFISVPGWVASSQFGYMQMVLGYLAGYLVVSYVLLPLYYKLNLTTIYSYLATRFGPKTYKTGAWYFILSRVVGASFRLFLVASVLQFAVFDAWGVPFYLTVILTIVFIWIYTFRAGIKTIVYTDTLQTLFMLVAVGLTLYFLIPEVIQENNLSGYFNNNPLSQIFFFDDATNPNFFWRQFFTGMFITITMTGLDQDMMQKNLTCKNLKEAQKNMLWFSVILIFVNFFFLFLGLTLTDFAQLNGLDFTGDQLYPSIALSGDFSKWVGITFIVGLIAAAYSSADSALTSLTTSFCVDVLEISGDSKKDQQLRKYVHIGFSVLLVIVILAFSQIASETIIRDLFKAAGFTYGPLLGFFAFGLFTSYKVKDKGVPVVAILAPVLSYVIQQNAEQWFGFPIQFEVLLINGAITFFGLWFLRVK